MILPDGTVKEGHFECNVYKGPDTVLSMRKSQKNFPSVAAQLQDKPQSSSTKYATSAAPDKTISRTITSFASEMHPHKF
jgi:hypothetical protein